MQSDLPARKLGISVSVDLPRETSKSEPNNGCFGTRASAEAISFCSSGDGVQTFSMLTFTCGCCGCEGSAACCAASGRGEAALPRRSEG